MKKHLRHLILALVWLFLPLLVQAQLSFTTNSGLITITGYSGGGDVIIPDSTNGYPITSIGDWAFENNSSITSVTIPNSVNSLGRGVFYFCTSLSSVNIPDGVPSIGDYTFIGCANLTSLTIPESVITIGDYALYGCTSLTNYIVDASNPAYSSLDGVLFDEAQATLVQFPAGKVGSYSIPNTVNNIGVLSFLECVGLTSVIIPETVSNIWNTTFYECTSLTNVIIPGSVISIGDSAFYGCTSLTSVVIPNGVISIGDQAFANCSNLTIVAIPDSATDIAYDAFLPCTSLISFNVGSSNPAYSSLNGVLFDKSQATLLQFPAGLVGSYTVPDTVTTIGFFAFSYSRGLMSVTIPSSVTNIDSFAFIYSTNLISAYFLGNAPPDPELGTMFDDNYFLNDPTIVYYLPGTTGWGPIFDSVPTALWNPQIQTGDVNFGLRNHQFGFNITGTTNLAVVVEACTNLASPVWTPLQTVTLTNGTFYFSDPQWVNYPNRFYGLGIP